MRNCDVCGRPLPVQTGRGGRRKRHPECSKHATRPAEPEIPTTESGAVPAVTAELQRLGATGSPEAAAALALAARIDADQEPGAALASLVKELRTLLASLRSSAAPAEVDPIDDLKARRAARAAG